MSQVPSTSASSTNFETILKAALKGYEKQTKEDIASHPLAAQLQSCDSSGAILTVLRAQVQTSEESQSADEKWTKWLDPTINVLFAFSATLGSGVGLVFPATNVIFTGIGVLLQAVKGVRAGQDILIDLFGRMEYFFKRLEKYVDIRPSAAMTDIIVQIMVEVILILGIVTKEIRQGQMKKFVKSLLGINDVGDALQRLDKLTQEEARMAAAETMVIAHDVDDRVKDVDIKVEGVDSRVQGVDSKVQGVDSKVQGVDSKLQGVGESVKGVDGRVKGIDSKVDSVLKGVTNYGVAIQQVANQFNNSNRNESRKDLRKWIAPPDPSVNFNTASDAHHKDTAAWCINGSTLADWKISGSLLWIHGKPGSGKSILSSVIIKDLKTISDSGSANMAYFFFDFKDKGKQDFRALLSSFLVQLSNQSDQFCDILFGLFSAHKNGSEQPSNDSLAGCLKNMLAIAGQVPIYLVVDALDECLNDTGFPTPREKVLELVNDLVELRPPNLRLCITSRSESDIRDTLGFLATQQLSLHDESGQKQDISDYVTSVVRSDQKMKKWRDDDKSMVVETLAEKADGMFRWVFCQLNVLRHCVSTDLRRTLEELPKSLEETYERILKGINDANWEHAHRLLQFIAVAGRPLRVEELAELLALDFTAGGIPKVNANWRREDEDMVLSACAGLVSIIIDNGSQVVQFSHSSVKEFLISDRLARSIELSRFHIPIEYSHVNLAQACFGVLLCLDDRTDKDSAEMMPLYRYAAKYWMWHARVGNVESHIKDAMDSFFDMDKPHISAWVRVQRPENLLRHSFVEERRAVPLSPAPLYIAALFGLRGLVERLIFKHPRHINSWGGLYGTPLHASVAQGHIKVAQLLLAHGADINSRSADDLTPLHFASRFGHSEIAEQLLNLGADVRVSDKYGNTPLHFAAEYGHLEVVHALLNFNAEVNSQCNRRFTPLQFASQNGHPDIVRLLLDHNADVHICNNGGFTPLHLAAHHGHLEVVQILLKLNVEVNSQSNHGFTPLLLASQNGQSDVVQSLLGYNADLCVRDNDGCTPLHLAAGCGHLEMVRILLKLNAEVNSQDNHRSTPLQLASQYGHPDVVQLLLDHNADLYVRNNDGYTPLHCAARNSHLEVVQILLKHNADVNSQNNHRSTPLLLASQGGPPDVVQLLLDHNADLCARDNDGDTPLHCAAVGGQLEVARILLGLNVDVNSQNNTGSTPLHLASGGHKDSKGYADVVRLLLDHGADVQVRNLDGHLASEVARGQEQQEIMQLLSKHAAE